MVPPSESTCLVREIEPLQGPYSKALWRHRGGHFPPARQQHIPCVSLEIAALNELVAQLVEQRPFNPNLG